MPSIKVHAKGATAPMATLLPTSLLLGYLNQKYIDRNKFNFAL